MRVSRVDEIDRAEGIHLADVDPAIAQDRMECPGRAWYWVEPASLTGATGCWKRHGRSAATEGRTPWRKRLERPPPTHPACTVRPSLSSAEAPASVWKPPGWRGPKAPS